MALFESASCLSSILVLSAISCALVSVVVVVVSELFVWSFEVFSEHAVKLAATRLMMNNLFIDLFYC